MKKVISLALVGAVTFVLLQANAQNAADRITVNFSDPSRPGLLRLDWMNGGVTVRAHTGQDVIIETRGLNNRNRAPAVRDGLRRIDGAGGVVVEEQNNVMRVTAGFRNPQGDLEIQVPQRTNLALKGLNGRAFIVEGVEGEIEVTNMNADVRLNNVAGSVVAHSANGRLIVSMRELTPDKPMSFSSMNGDVDLTLPASAKATLKMRADNGGTYSDFEVQLRPSTAPTVEDSRIRGGRIRIQTDRTVNGTINGGGPEFELRTLNGNIYIRKGK